jgi:hypothetical protein
LVDLLFPDDTVTEGSPYREIGSARNVEALPLRNSSVVHSGRVVDLYVNVF